MGRLADGGGVSICVWKEGLQLQKAERGVRMMLLAERISMAKVWGLNPQCRETPSGKHFCI